MPATQMQRTILAPCVALLPTIRDVVDVFEGLESGLGFVQFNYVTQRKPRKSCPSVDAQREDTRYSRAGEADPSLVRGYVPHGGEYESGGYWVFENKSGESLIRLRSMDRQSNGLGYHQENGEMLDSGRYLWRSYLVGGIKLDTVQAVVPIVNDAGKVVRQEKTRLFPNAPEGYRNGR